MPAPSPGNSVRPQSPMAVPPAGSIPTPTPGPKAAPGPTPSAAPPATVGNAIKPQNTPAPTVDVMPDADMPVFQNHEGYSYDPTGRRDPFKPYGESQSTQAPDISTPERPSVPVEPLQMYDISQYRLLGIVWEVRDPKAMIMDPTGRTHMIRRQTRIGRNNGFVASIREGEVIVVEPSVGDNGVQTAITRVMNLK